MSLSDIKAEIPYLFVAGFHHQIGNIIEHIYPEPPEEVKQSYHWEYIPFLALPGCFIHKFFLEDGVHQLAKFVTFFILYPLPTAKQGTPCLFGVSCFKQISAKLLDLTNMPDVVRPMVQKAVGVLCTYPFFGLLRSRLTPITDLYFAQRDFTNTAVLKNMHETLCTTLERPLSQDALLVGLPIPRLVSNYGELFFVLFKALLLQKKILLFSGKDISLLVSSVAVSLASLIPQAILGITNTTNEETKKDEKVKEDMEDEDDDSNKNAHVENEAVNYHLKSIVYIRNLPPDVKEAAVRPIFEQIGKVKSFALLVNPLDGKKLGCGYVKYFTENSAIRCIASLNNKSVNGKRIELHRCSIVPPLPGQPPQPAGVEIPLKEDEPQYIDLQQTSSVVAVGRRMKLNKQPRYDALKFPLKLFSEQCPLIPFVTIKQLQSLCETKGYLAGTTNLLIFQSPLTKADVLFDLTTKELIIRDEELKNALEITQSDKKFVESFRTVCLKTEENLESSSTVWEGTSDWVECLHTSYISNMLSAISELESFADDEGISQKDIQLLSDFNVDFVKQFIKTDMFFEWRNSLLYSPDEVDLTMFAPPMHPFGTVTTILEKLTNRIDSYFKSFESFFNVPIKESSTKSTKKEFYEEPAAEETRPNETEEIEQEVEDDHVGDNALIRDNEDMKEEENESDEEEKLLNARINERIRKYKQLAPREKEIIINHRQKVLKKKKESGESLTSEDVYAVLHSRLDADEKAFIIARRKRIVREIIEREEANEKNKQQNNSFFGGFFSSLFATPKNQASEEEMRRELERRRKEREKRRQEREREKVQANNEETDEMAQLKQETSERQNEGALGKFSDESEKETE